MGVGLGFALGAQRARRVRVGDVPRLGQGAGQPKTPQGRGREGRLGSVRVHTYARITNNISNACRRTALEEAPSWEVCGSATSFRGHGS